MAARKQADRQQGEVKSREYWQAQIVEAIKDFYYGQFELETVADIQKTPHNVFNAALQYANSQCVKRGDLLEYVPHTIESSGAIVHNETYNAKAVGELCSAYISLCALFDRVPCVYSFALLSGIDRTTLEGWVNDAKGVSSADRVNKQKSIRELKTARAASLSNMALSGGKSALGAIAHLNNEIWNNQTTPEQSARPLSVAELPVLALPGSAGGSAPVGVPDRGRDLVELPVLGSELPVLGGND